MSKFGVVFLPLRVVPGSRRARPKRCARVRRLRNIIVKINLAASEMPQKRVFLKRLPVFGQKKQKVGSRRSNFLENCLSKFSEIFRVPRAYSGADSIKFLSLSMGPIFFKMGKSDFWATNCGFSGRRSILRA